MKGKQLSYVLLAILIGLKVNGQETKQNISNMIIIPAGEFIMGKDSEKGHDYSPSHKVQVDSFFIDRHEVTNYEYFQFCKETGHKLPEFWNSGIFKSGEAYPDYPVIGVSWGDANKYAEWIGKRLPTEAEWEYAARGGLIDKEYPKGNEWVNEEIKQDTTGWKNLIYPIEKYEPNGYGLYDMDGNVWEWVHDKYSAEYYKTSGNINPQGPTDGRYRVIRGGSWHSGPMCKKVYYRNGLPSSWCDFAVGFRCVKDVDLRSRKSSNVD